jgi:hypothetical protein
MTKEELKEHCKKQIEMCEMWAHNKGEEPSGKVYEEHKLILELLEQQPKIGHWIVDVHRIRAFGSKNETHEYSVHCDKCNYVWDYTTDKERSLVSNFCPNCGADMREVEE